MDWTRKVAGVPTWGWAALLGGGALVVMIRRRQQAAASSAGQGSSGVSAAYGAAAIDPATGVPYSSELATAQQQVPNSQVTLPSGASYSGPASGLGQVLGELQPSQPTTGPDGAPAGYAYIHDPAVGSYLTAAGTPVFVQLGPPSSNGPVVPFTQGVQAPAGSSELYQVPSK